MRGIDVFSGAGGMSIGAEWAGIETVLAVDADPHAARTYALNHPDAEVVCSDIRAIDFKPYNTGEECILFGGPPCQGFSTSNQRTRNSKNENNWLFREFLRAVEEIMPDWVIFENVKGIAETENAKFLDFVISGLEELNFSVKPAVLNAKDYGVPQTRSRQFVVAGKYLDNFEFPKAIDRRPVTVGEAISDLPIVQNGAATDRMHYSSNAKSAYAKFMRQQQRTVSGNLVTRNAANVLARYRHIPQGGNWEDIPKRLMKNYKDASRCHTGIYRRLEWDNPAVTIGNYRKNMLVHPIESRGLSVREAARLQSFPDRFEFFGSIGFQQQQVGNAVPPLLAKAVFTEIKKASVANRQSWVAAE